MPMMSVNIDDHNRMVEKLWDDFEKRCNKRIPIVIVCDEQFQLPLYGTSYGKYYSDPLLMAKVQLETAKWWMNNIVHDGRMGLPKEHWTIHPQLWMVEKEFFGCQAVYQENDYAWAKPISAPKEDLLAMLWDIDPVERLKENKGYLFHKRMKQEFEGKEFQGIPIKVGPPNGIAGTHGIFTTAAEVRGQYELLIDMQKDPDFVKAFLEVITEKIIGKIEAWNSLSGEEKKLPTADGWGMADDSVNVLSPKLFEEFVLPFYKRIYSEMTTGIRGIHLCGHAEQLFEILHDEVGIMSFDGPGPWIDIGWMRDRFGTDVRVNAQVYHHKLRDGTPQEIDNMVRSILTVRAKRGGYMNLVGYPVRGTPPENLRTLYEMGLKYGQVPTNCG